MSLITPQLLRQIMPHLTQAKAEVFAPALADACARFEIDTPGRLAAFLAQVSHESGELRYMVELASGQAYDTGKKAVALGNTPEADGDGQLYKGRGPIQLTGLHNYVAALMYLDLDLVNHPELLAEPPAGCAASALFWWSNKLNSYADKDDFVGLTRRINGGTNGLADRQQFWDRAKRALGVTK
ncbi:glycoside hydrolase family 19 protein [Cupriavidus sp. DL-D2]|uniref:glycoside hydrolase family 19 protein n=1 Tax=Cupriavidus sp. DL-D2 TaxID=3144974 RepID=UPI0032156112